MPKKQNLVKDQDKERLKMTNLELEQKILAMQETIGRTISELHLRDDEIKKLNDIGLETQQRLEELKTRIGALTKDPERQKDQAFVESTRITTQNVKNRLKDSGLTPDEQAAVLKKMS